MPGPTSRALDYGKVRAWLDGYAAWLAARPEVELVVLFGSLATGEYTGSSDADLLIVVERSPQDFLTRAHSYHPGRSPLPLELFVYTRAEFEALRKQPGLVATALREGVVLYRRSGTEAEHESRHRPLHPA